MWYALYVCMFCIFRVTFIYYKNAFQYNAYRPLHVSVPESVLRGGGGSASRRGLPRGGSVSMGHYLSLHSV